MKVTVRAKPMASEEKVEKLDDYSFVIWVKEPPYKGLANATICAALANYFKKPKSCIRLVSGFSSKFKTFEIY